MTAVPRRHLRGAWGAVIRLGGACRITKGSGGALRGRGGSWRALGGPRGHIESILGASTGLGGRADLGILKALGGQERNREYLWGPGGHLRLREALGEQLGRY